MKYGFLVASQLEEQYQHSLTLLGMVGFLFLLWKLSVPLLSYKTQHSEMWILWNYSTSKCPLVKKTLWIWKKIKTYLTTVWFKLCAINGTFEKKFDFVVQPIVV